jgi:hypothetical protein
MDAAIDAQAVIETDTVTYPDTVNEDGHMLPQVALFVEYVTTQPRVHVERGFERIAQDAGGRVDFGDFGEASQLLRENQLCHKRLLHLTLMVRCVIKESSFPQGEGDRTELLSMQ